MTGERKPLREDEVHDTAARYLPGVIASQKVAHLTQALDAGHIRYHRDGARALIRGFARCNEHAQSDVAADPELDRCRGVEPVGLVEGAVGGDDTAPTERVSMSPPVALLEADFTATAPVFGGSLSRIRLPSTVMSSCAWIDHGGTRRVAVGTGDGGVRGGEDARGAHEGSGGRSGGRGQGGEGAGPRRRCPASS